MNLRNNKKKWVMETFYLRKIFEKLKEFWKLILKKHIFFHNIMEKKNWKLQVTKILRIFRKYKKTIWVLIGQNHTLICMLKNKSERSYIHTRLDPSQTGLKSISTSIRQDDSWYLLSDDVFVPNFMRFLAYIILVPYL
jgi:hypothetical protein